MGRRMIGKKTINERITPEMFIAHFTSMRKIKVADIGVSPVVVLAWHRNVVESLAKATGARLSKYWIYSREYPLYSGEVNGLPVSFIHVPVGAPGTVMIMEEMIACGARVFLGLGLAGSLQPTAPIGTCLIPTSCIREEGTSVHYISEESGIVPSRRLVKTLQESCRTKKVKFLSGPIWTTDAPYRELVSKIETYGKQGVLGVDMETSAMYALGRFRNVEVANFLVVSDELWHEWQVASGSSRLQKAIKKAKEVILHSLDSGVIVKY